MTETGEIISCECGGTLISQNDQRKEGSSENVMKCQKCGLVLSPEKVKKEGKSSLTQEEIDTLLGYPSGPEKTSEAEYDMEYKPELFAKPEGYEAVARICQTSV